MSTNSNKKKANITMNKKEVYKNRVEPLVEELKKVCYDEGIPMFIACAVADNGKETEYKNEMVSPLGAKAPLSNNLLALFVDVLQGYKVIPPQDMEEIEY